jgi:type I restriction enzyme S subunit
MRALPAGWATASIADIALFNPKTVAEDSMNAGFAPMQLLGTRYRDRMVFEERPWGEIKKAYVHFQQGDVIVAKVTPCFENGKAGIAPPLPNGLGAGSSEFCVFRPAQGIDERYLLAWLSTEDFRRRATVAMTGSVGLKRVPKEVFLSERIPLAPESEQKRIADKLDGVLARVDAVNTRLASVAPILKRFRQTVLAAATSGRLTEDWREQCEAEARRTFALSDLVVSIDQGWSPKCGADAAPPDRWAVIKTTAIQALHFYPEENKALPNDLDPRPSLALADGDVLITRAGPRSRAGIACVVKGDHPRLMLCDKAYRIRVDRSKVLPQMLNLLLNSPEILEVIDGMKTGISESGVNLTQAKFRELALSVPRIAEQAEIVRRVETLFAFADRLETRLHAAQAATARMTPALLAKAFRGELVPQDSNDEPASELLRRLQQEAPSPRAKRRRKSAA